MGRTSAPKIPISRPTKFSRLPGRSSPPAGFSLVEILIVIGLIGLIMGLYITDMGGILRINLEKTARELATTIRTAHDEAILKGQVHRIAFDMDKGQYWVEIGDRSFLMRSAEQEEQERRLAERRSDEEKAQHKDPFAMAKTVTKKRIKLPFGVKFTEIQTPRSPEPSKAGIVYAHVFPHGFIEKLIIHLKDGSDREFTLVVNPVTGKSRLFQHYYKEPLS